VWLGVLVPCVGCGVVWFFVLGCVLVAVGVGGAVFCPVVYVVWGGMGMDGYFEGLDSFLVFVF
jgi:hypothetical protein